MNPQRWQTADLIPSDEDRDATLVLLIAAVSLLLFEYWGRPPFYRSSGVSDWVASSSNATLADLADAGAYVWWGLSSVLWRVVLPFGLAAWWLGRRPSELGFRFRGIASHLPVYGVLYLAMLPLLVLVSGFDSFSTFYPFYERAGEGGLGFWVYQAGYALQFLGVEAFFRGFMLFGLAPRIGWLAIPVMTIPYAMIHFTKPMPEAVAAIVAGIVLGVLALRSRSFIPGLMLHIAVAVTMDLLVLGRAGVLGNVFGF